MSKKQQIVLLVLVAVLILGGVSYGSYYFWQKSLGNQNQKACTEEAKLCPDGSAVGRTGANCEFALCPSVTVSPDATVDSSSKASATEDWRTYKNKQYGFEFKYPPKSAVETRQDLNYQYIRLQNYSSTDAKPGFAQGEYYLEIFIFDHNLGHRSSQCKQSIYEPKKVEIGVVSGYRGSGVGGGYAGGRFALCAERPEVDFHIQGTEYNEKAPLVNYILDSFKFTK